MTVYPIGKFRFHVCLGWPINKTIKTIQQIAILVLLIACLRNLAALTEKFFWLLRKTSFPWLTLVHSQIRALNTVHVWGKEKNESALNQSIGLLRFDLKFIHRWIFNLWKPQTRCNMTLHKILPRPQWWAPDYDGSHVASNFSAILSVAFQQKSSSQHVILKYILINHSQLLRLKGGRENFSPSCNQ